ncbi:M48 family metallopeptidase [Roseovarius aestuariivivens]|uniref:M48 family metallopeptidase n=1 Tax=Roseovarius aestuariivivens TaxID=1888910 RepID=UPI001080804A|nr:SprT family zinc-dependent metalloprotease [Roseovarius aestuariivivens]
MGHHLLPGNPPVPVELRRSGRARQISLRVSGVDGKVTLTLPRGVAEREALAFAQSKAGWLRSQLARQPETVVVGLGARIPVAGETVTLQPGAGRRVRLEDGLLYVPGEAATAARRVQAWLKATARDRLAKASDRYAAALGRPYSRITLRDTRSRWGSCTQDGGLMYSWRLVMAPPEVLDYVAAHEVAHLAEMNHSRAFWDTVARLMPGYNAPRAWLRAQGGALHRYRFKD